MNSEICAMGIYSYIKKFRRSGFCVDVFICSSQNDSEYIRKSIDDIAPNFIVMDHFTLSKMQLQIQSLGFKFNSLIGFRPKVILIESFDGTSVISRELQKSMNLCGVVPLSINQLQFRNFIQSIERINVEGLLIMENYVA